MRRITTLSALWTTAAILFSTPAIAQEDFSKIEIEAVEIKPGIAVLFGRGGNIGVSHGEDGTVLIDDQFAPLTEKIQAAVASLGATPAKYLINSHSHYDHTDGNENFGNAGAIIVAHDSVRVRLMEGSTVHGWVAPPAPAAALPVLTFDEGMTLHLNGDDIEVIFHGGGHTDGDAVIYWRKANVLHTGDMFMHQLGWPFVDLGSGGNVEHLLNTLARMIAIADAETIIIPGHGQLATRSDLIGFRDMIVTGVDAVREFRATGASLEDALATNVVAGLRNAEGFISDEDFVISVWGSLDAHGH